ncbi:MAG: hypothetical protein MMC33_002418 [Icmadophila ericetorum]|nr:hypothetical protein [Icmadophila ericetorum]
MRGSSRTTARDMNDYDPEWQDTPKVWHCCKKPQESTHCRRGRHQDKESYEKATWEMKNRKGMIGEPEVVDPCEGLDEDSDDPYGMGW